MRINEVGERRKMLKGSRTGVLNEKQGGGEENKLSTPRQFMDCVPLFSWFARWAHWEQFQFSGLESFYFIDFVDFDCRVEES